MDREAGRFQSSLEALAQLAVRATGARSCVIIDDDSPARPESKAPAIVEYPLRTGSAVVASVVFAFCSDTEALKARPRLARIAAAMQAIWSAADRYSHLVRRVSDLEAQLIDSKITDRAHGLLTGETNLDPTEAIARHVDSVLRPTPTTSFLEQVLSEREDEIEERRLVAQAKEILCAADRLSEEQAHHQLRLMSRKSRKPLKAVAQQVIDGQPWTRYPPAGLWTGDCARTK
jgi:AmiR/NasT family two-component response regulator